jgi:lysyl-tRNA synthetase class 2
MHELNEQELARRNALTEMRKLGIEPYPAAEYQVNVSAKEILEKYNPEAGNYQNVSIAGRIMSRRIMGSASFMELQDATGRIQIYVKRDDLCPDEDKTMYNTVFKRLLDIGDIIGVKGFVFITQMGETSIHVKELTVLSKSLRVLPIVKEKDGQIFDAFTDPEQRYRMRYVDLLVNPHVKDTFMKRTQVINTMRDFFNSKGYVEVDTPVLQPIPGGAAARPFTTHHNALDIPLYLRIANELYLKRLIVGGFDGVYEFSRNFRNEGMDRTHNPEFTVLEIYVAYKDYNWMMDFTEEMMERVALALHGITTIPLTRHCGLDPQSPKNYEIAGQVRNDSVKTVGHMIDFKRPFRRLPMLEAIREYAGVDVSGMDEKQLRDVCQQMNIPINDAMGKGKLIDAIFDEKCEKHLVQPTFIIDYPIEMSPLCKRHRENPELTERFELFVNGKELCNAYSELNDPIDQLERFQEQLKLSEKGDDEAMFIDMDFVRALEYGMPPTSGMGIGVDRLVMLMTNQASSQEVLFFPQMRPEKKARRDSADDYTAAGIPVEWVEPVQKMGFLTVESLKGASAGKLFNDLCGYNKKNKLGLKNPTADEVKGWVGN